MSHELDECIREIERELGKLTTERRLALERIIERYGKAVAAHNEPNAWLVW